MYLHTQYGREFLIRNCFLTIKSIKLFVFAIHKMKIHKIVFLRWFLPNNWQTFTRIESQCVVYRKGKKTLARTMKNIRNKDRQWNAINTMVKISFAVWFICSFWKLHHNFWTWKYRKTCYMNNLFAFWTIYTKIRLIFWCIFFFWSHSYGEMWIASTYVHFAVWIVFVFVSQSHTMIFAMTFSLLGLACRANFNSPHSSKMWDFFLDFATFQAWTFEWFSLNS